jgi:hypothetical protein
MRPLMLIAAGAVALLAAPVGTGADIPCAAALPRAAPAADDSVARVCAAVHVVCCAARASDCGATAASRLPPVLSAYVSGAA